MLAVLNGLLLPIFQISKCKVTVFPKLWPGEVREEPVTPSDVIDSCPAARLHQE